jgi:hypothetical protein
MTKSVGLVALCALATACSPHDSESNPPTDAGLAGAQGTAGGGASGSATTDAGRGAGGAGTGGDPTTDAGRDAGGTGAGGDLASDAGRDAGGAGAGGNATGDAGAGAGPVPTGAAMPLISRDVPAFASNGEPAAANDDAPNTAWGSGPLPSFIAYDLSATPPSERQQILVAWYAIRAPCYIDEGASGERPIAYTLETNSAPGGGEAPTSGWNVALEIEDNRYCGRHHLLDLGGASWLRMNVTEGTDPSVSFELDVYSAPNGASDSWLFMGDSITYMAMTHAFSDLSNLVAEKRPDHFPAALDAALGGTNTSTAKDIIDDTLQDFPGRYVVLAYGTNDHADEFQMEALVQKVTAAGKTPVVPHMPWSEGSAEGEAINLLIDGLYAKYPEIVKGPDLWKVFENRTDLIPSGDVHPNDEGQKELRKAWASMMVETYP